VAERETTLSLRSNAATPPEKLSRNGARRDFPGLAQLALGSHLGEEGLQFGDLGGFAGEEVVAVGLRRAEWAAIDHK
jgi:hypothetical protein